MKILHVAHTYYPCLSAGGVVNASYQIGLEQVKNGNYVHVYTSDTCKTRMKLEKRYNVEVNGISVDYFRNLFTKLKEKTLVDTPISAFLKIRKDIKNYDIIHIHEHRQTLAIITTFYARKYNIPYVVQAHGSVLPFFQKESLKNIYDKLWGFKTLHNASKVFALTDIEKDQYLKMGVKEENISIVPLGINLNEYDNLENKKFLREKYDLNDDTVIILFIGRLHEIKGLDLLVNSFNLLNNNENKDIRLFIVGPDDGYGKTIETMIKEYELENKVILTGPLYNEDKINALVDCDIFVMPSKYESFTTSGLEAMACSKPLVLTKNNHIHYWVNNTVGLTCEYDKNDLKTKLEILIEDKTLRDKLGKQGRELIENKYNWDNINKEIISIYETILNKK